MRACPAMGDSKARRASGRKGRAGLSACAAASIPHREETLVGKQQGMDTKEGLQMGRNPAASARGTSSGKQRQGRLDRIIAPHERRGWCQGCSTGAAGLASTGLSMTCQCTPRARQTRCLRTATPTPTRPFMRSDNPGHVQHRRVMQTLVTYRHTPFITTYVACRLSSQVPAMPQPCPTCPSPHPAPSPELVSAHDTNMLSFQTGQYTLRICRMLITPPVPPRTTPRTFPRAGDGAERRRHQVEHHEDGEDLDGVAKHPRHEAHHAHLRYGKA